MELLERGNIVSTIIFTKSAETILDEQRNIAIKSILSRVEDLVKDEATVQRIRKEVLDQLNDFSRVSKDIVESIAEAKNNVR